MVTNRHDKIIAGEATKRLLVTRLPKPSTGSSSSGSSVLDNATPSRALSHGGYSNSSSSSSGKRNRGSVAFLMERELREASMDFDEYIHMGGWLKTRQLHRISELKSMVFTYVREDYQLLELGFGSEKICVRILDDAARQQWRRAFSIVFQHDEAGADGKKKTTWAVNHSEVVEG